MREIVFTSNSDGSLFNFRRTLLERIRQNEKVTVISGTSLEADYSDRLNKLGIGTHIVRSGIIPVYFRLAFVLFKKLKGMQARDCLLIYTLPSMVMCGFLLNFVKCDFRVIATVTGLGRHFQQNMHHLSLKQKVFMKIFKLVFRKFDHIVFQNGDDLKLFEHYGIARDSGYHLVSGSGVDLTKFTPSQEKNVIEGDKIKILYIGRALRLKGFLEFVESAKKLSSDARFEFLFAGNIDPKFQDEVGDFSELCVQSGIKNLGFVTDTPRLLDSVDLIIAPSTYREGIPRSLIEAAAMDKYIITCNTVGNKEVVRDGYNGRFVPFGDVAAIKNAVLEYAASDRGSYTGRSRQIAEERFDVANIDDYIIGLMND